MSQRSPGHLFVIEGHLARVSCDALLVPASSALRTHFSGASTLVAPGLRERLDHRRGSRWRLLRDPATRHPTVWLANVSDCEQTPEAFAELASAFVRRAARASGGRKPRVALGVVGIDRGAVKCRRGALIECLVTSLSHAAEASGVDVVLVAADRQEYAAAQYARRRLPLAASTDGAFSSAADPCRLETVVDELAEYARQSRLVLFVGAGVSRGAGTPGWQQLLDLLAEGADVDATELRRLHELEPTDQAQILATRLGRRRYADLLRQHLMTNKYALAHGLLASLDPHEVATTNFDTSMEDAMMRRPAVLPQESVGRDGRWILKLHGTITDTDSVVLTRSDHLGLTERSHALLGVVQAMLMTRYMLFVGYSLTDDSFHRVVHEVRRARQTVDRGSQGTVLTLFEDPMVEQMWSDVLDVVPLSRRPRTITDSDTVTASRRLDIVLDQIALRAAEPGAFLLDPDYEDLLHDSDRDLRHAIERAKSAAEAAGPMAEQLREVLDAAFPATPARPSRADAKRGVRPKPGGGYSVRMSDDRIDEQEAEEFGKAQADRPPTEDEERLAEEAARGIDVDKVAEHYEDMAERGAHQKGEGRID